MESGQSILTMEYILRTNIRQATKPMVPAEEEGVHYMTEDVGTAHQSVSRRGTP